MAAGTIEVVLSNEARQHLTEADDYWLRDHDGINPLVVQVNAAVELLKTAPQCGKLVYPRPAGSSGEYRYFILRVGWQLYYLYDPSARRVVVTAIWYAGRDSRPPRR